MSDINFHKPYEGKKNNRYTYNIQLLYNYQSMVQKITKELRKILRENTFIENYINRMTDSANVRSANLMKIIENIEKPNNDITTYVSNLCKARKIYLDEISSLEQYINTLPVPQNNNNGNNNENNQENHIYFQELKPKQKKRLANMQKIEDSRTKKGIKRTNSKLNREANLGRSTIRRNINRMQKEQKSKYLYEKGKQAYIDSQKQMNKNMGIEMPNSYYENLYYPPFNDLNVNDN